MPLPTPPAKDAEPGSGPRRLPIFLLLDCSGSMRGGALDTARQTIRALLSRLREAPRGQAPLIVSLISYDSRAVQLNPLTPVEDFDPDAAGLADLCAVGTSALGDALRLVKDSMDRELERPGSPQGDLAPVLFLFTDGIPTDEEELKRQRRILASTSVYVLLDQASDLRKKYFEEILCGTGEARTSFLPFTLGADVMLEYVYAELRNLKDQKPIRRPRGYIQARGIVAR